MGELALRKLQAGLETTRGTAVLATRKLYGTLQPSRDQVRRYAVEDRGMFPEKVRATAATVDAGFRLDADLTPEDYPYYLDLSVKGGVTPTQIGTSSVYQWIYVPDQTSDSLKTRTFEWGDDSVAYRGAFATLDQLDVAIALDNVARLTMQGWVQEWLPQGSGGFTGFTGGLADRAVESVEGWQQRLFIDPGTGTIGTTWVTGRFVSAAVNFHNQNKRKWFGDGSPYFTALGRGRRQVSCGVVFEAFDQTQVGDLFSTNQAGNLPVERAVRLMMIGSPLTTTALGTTSGIVAAGVVTTIPVTALAQAIPGGIGISIGGNQFVVAPAGAASAATSIPVISQTIPAAIASGASVYGCKTVTHDFWGVWDGNPNWGARETNVTFQLMLQGVYDATQAKEAQVTVYNGLSAAAGIS